MVREHHGDETFVERYAVTVLVAMVTLAVGMALSIGVQGMFAPLAAALAQL
jgi:Flp pilus assembly pilin Flp